MRKILAVLTIVILSFTFATQPASARSLGYRWSSSAGHWPYIIVEQHTTSFPVYTATKRWGSPFHYGTCSRYPTKPCVKVYPRDLGNTGTAGQTVIVHTDTRMLGATIYANTRNTGGSFYYKLYVIMHELGHAAGLDHGGYGVMQSSVHPYIHWPSYGDKADLRRVYGVR